jgi:protein xylosyltransferase
MIVALFRRYKFFFFIGLAILGIQIFLAYKSIKIPIESSDGEGRWSEKASNKREFTKSPRQKHLAAQNDDEDIINSNIQQQDVAHKSEKSSSSNLLSDLRFKPKCDILNDREVVSAVQRARTQNCKEHIIDVACQIKSNTFYPEHLPNTCPSGNYIANRSLGCFKDDKKHRLLPGFYSNFKETNSPKKCIQMCLQSGYLYAGVQYSTECFCGNTEPPTDTKLPDPNCNMKCPAEPKSACGGYYTINVYETGIASKLRIMRLLPVVCSLNRFRIFSTNCGSSTKNPRQEDSSRFPADTQWESAETGSPIAQGAVQC